MTMKPIPDKAEVALDFPDKAYMGTFERDSAFEARAAADGITLKLERRSNPKRVVEIHLHHDLFAAILEDLAQSFAEKPPIDDLHRELLVDGARNLNAALKGKKAPSG